MNCRACNRGALARFCDACAIIREYVRAHSRGSFMVIVDGSYRDRRGGAGFVLTMKEAPDIIIATSSAGFASQSSSDAEYQAAVRGLRWAAGDVADVICYSDCITAVARAQTDGHRVKYLAKEHRTRCHSRAHQLANQSRKERTPPSRTSVE